MNATKIVGTSLTLLWLVLMSGCAGCEDEFATGCTSDEECRVGRMCIEEACAPAQDAGRRLDDDDAGDDPDPDGPSGEETPGTPTDPTPTEPGTPGASMVDEYCEMESRCIAVCVNGPGETPCDSRERQDACREDFVGWYESLTSQDTRCAQTVDSWVECISTASCNEVEEFFSAHPDGVTDATPCGGEFFKMECMDFEPVTEYGF